MNDAALFTPQWLITTRATGEDLSTRVEGAGVGLLLMGRTPGLSAAEREAWLRELIGVAGEAGRGAEPGSGPALPVLLYHSLSGLLFYEEELWGSTPGRPPCSAAFVEVDGSAAFGWVGEAEIAVEIDGRPVEPPWMRVRGENGRDARALALESGRDTLVRLTWRDEEGDAATAEARWGAEESVGPSAAAAESERTASLEPAVEDFDAPGIATIEVDADTFAQEFGTSPVAARSEPADATEEEIDERATTREATRSTVDVPDDSIDPDTDLAHDVASEEPRERGAWHFRSWFRRLLGGTPHERAESDDVPTEEESAPTESTFRTHDEDREAVATDEPGASDVESVEAEPYPPNATPVRDDEPSGEEASMSEEQQALYGPPPTVALEVHEDAGDVDDRERRPVEGLPLPDWIPPTPEPAELTALTASLEREVEEDPFETADLPERIPDRSEATENVEPTEELRTRPMALDVAASTSLAEEPGAVTPGTTPAQVASVDEPERLHELSTLAPPSRPLPPRGLRRAWPEEREEPPTLSKWRKRWPWAVAVALLFAVGWMVGSVDRGTKRPSFAARALGGLGLGAKKYEVVVTSRPPGAWISVDGVDAALRTPSTLELVPGAHQIGLSFSGLGSATYSVRGERGEKVPVDATLWGSLAISAPDETTPVSVQLDGADRGFAPISVDSVEPGLHRVRFVGRGIEPWERTVEVRVNQTTEVMAVANTSPATGFVEVRATLASDQGTEPLRGAAVYVDGIGRGATPLRLELPRGPHSFRVSHRGEDAPIQVIDLPGGNQRFLTFELGTLGSAPRLVQTTTLGAIPLDRPTVVSGGLDGVRDRDVRDMWLHVRTPDGSWRRYPMSVLPSPGGAVGVCVFPTTLFDASGRAPYYLSASTRTGDEFFTEIQFARPAR